jgi:2-polyprenyl-3-methyl-5-hydroxy-6-metoxy-1,4-benzoquinol methylase
MTQSKQHWDNVYSTKSADSVSWFQPVPDGSLRALRAIDASPQDSLIDVGGGASTLAASLHNAGWIDISVLDISAAAVQVARAHLATQADQIDWIVADITQWQPLRTYAIWHDRAVFHFMTTPEMRAGYGRALMAALPIGGHAIIATFATNGPEKCSGLPIVQYDADTIIAALPEGLTLLDQFLEAHHTPGGGVQNFAWFVLKRTV